MILQQHLPGSIRCLWHEGTIICTLCTCHLFINRHPLGNATSLTMTGCRSRRSCPVLSCSLINSVKSKSITKKVPIYHAQSPIFSLLLFPDYSRWRFTTIKQAAGGIFLTGFDQWEVLRAVCIHGRLTAAGARLLPHTCAESHTFGPLLVRNFVNRSTRARFQSAVSLQI